MIFPILIIVLFFIVIVMHSGAWRSFRMKHARATLAIHILMAVLEPELKMKSLEKVANQDLKSGATDSFPKSLTSGLSAKR
jgi:hypothetical protein